MIVFCSYAAYFKSGGLIRNCHEKGGMNYLHSV